MLMTQVYTLLNTVVGEILGDTVIVKEDLTNVIDVGKAFEDSSTLDNYVKALNDQIGKMVFVDRIYQGRAPSVLMDGWEFGSILEKVSMELPEATANSSWSLVDGQSYDPNIFYQPTVTVSCWNDRVTLEVPMSFTEKQVKSAFTNATQLNAFMSMIHGGIINTLTIRLDKLVMMTIANLLTETVKDDFGISDLGSTSGVKAVNLLYLYNTKFTKTLTASESITDPDFLKFASFTIGKYVERLQVMSDLFNIGGKSRFTPKERLHIVMLADFKKGADVYLQSDTFNSEMTKMPEAESVAFWQGSGLTFDFEDVSKINVKNSLGHEVIVSGVLCTMFDREALGVCNQDPRVTSNYNAKGEFFNEYHKFDAQYFNDVNENMVVFFTQDAIED